jgi:hypothetical protein
LGGGVEPIGTKAVDTSSCEKSSWELILINSGVIFGPTGLFQ